METGELNCEKRAVKPRSMITALRRQGRVPAVLYGPGTPPTPVSVSGIELRYSLSAASHARIVRLKSGASELDGRHVIFKEVQHAPVSGAVLHADLYEVDLTRAIQVEVPLKFTGRARGVADGGILQPLVRALTVECLPLEIPEAIEIDVTELGVHEVIHVSAVKVPGNVQPIFDQDYAVVSVLPPTVAEAPTPQAGAAEGAPEEGAAAEGAAAGAAAAPEGAAKEAAAPAAAAAGGAKKAEPAAKK
ncbi:MAG: 50S ribosomal protein L25 [Deltaproteobacteria bacterium]|nr:50S ribosomal protein L25 [Deltaproteobacteria bacterium]